VPCSDVHRITLLTQCEAQGLSQDHLLFPDRPDVADALHRVPARADRQRFPVLLSNGNLVQEGDLSDGRPFCDVDESRTRSRATCSLLVCREAAMPTSHASRRARAAPVRLQLWGRRSDSAPPRATRSNCLERAIGWDERRFGLELDLDRYMIVGGAGLQFRREWSNNGLKPVSARAMMLADPYDRDRRRLRGDRGGGRS